jgi:hypothetical protein
MIYELNISTWNKLVELFSDGFYSYGYRGQSEYEVSLSTLIERISKLHGHKLSSLSNREFWILTQFKRRAHNLLMRPPSYDDAIEWLALIQHHGGPTRLLDFTRSPYVALFFACENATADAALWMLDVFDLAERHHKMKADDTIYHQNKSLLEQAQKYIGLETEDVGILPIVPELINERMAIQQGLALMPINLKISFMKNLMNEYNWTKISYQPINLKEFRRILYSKDHPLVLKIRLRKEWHPKILHALDRMNINAKTLFPGLDGFARSLRLHLYDR